MVFMSSSALDWSPLCRAWLNTLPPRQSDILWDLFNAVFQVCLAIRQFYNCFVYCFLLLLSDAELFF